jgi:hypothetical protein
MLSALLAMVIIVVAVAIVWWILQQMPLPAQFRWIVNILLGLIALLVLLYFVAPMLHLVH